MKPWSRQTWRRYLGFAGSIAAVGTAIDIPNHAWPQLGITLGATAVTLLTSRRGFRRAAQREAHRPDYAKIAALEIELGLVEAPKQPSVFDGPPPAGPYVRKSQPGRREMYQAPPPPVLAREPVEVYPDAQPGTMNDYLNQVGRQVKWQRCPVCTRVHEGRCPG